MRAFFDWANEYRTQLIKNFIIAAVILFCLVLGPILRPFVPAIDSGLKWLAIGAGAIIFAILATVNMPATLTILVATSCTVSVTISSGGASGIPFSLVAIFLLTILCLIRIAFIKPKIQMVPSKIYIPFWCLLGVLFISWLNGYVVWNPRVIPPDNLFFIQTAQVAIFIGTFAALFLAANTPLSEKYLKWWTIIVIGIGTFTIVVRLVVNRLFANDLVTYAMLNWPFILLWSQLIFNSELKPWLRIGGGAISVIWAYWAFSQSLSWKGGFVPALMGLFFMIWFKSRKLFYTLSMIFVVLLAVNWSWFDQHILQDALARGDAIRPSIWWDVIKMTSSSPFIGLGPTNYKFYWTDPLFFPESRLSNWDAWNELGYAPPSHNMFVDIFSQTGIIGLGIYLWVMILGLILCYRLAARLKPGFISGYVYAVLCGFAALNIASFIFADVMIPFYYNISITQFRTSVYSWLFLGTVIALDYSTKKDDRKHA